MRTEKTTIMIITSLIVLYLTTGNKIAIFISLSISLISLINIKIISYISEVLKNFLFKIMLITVYFLVVLPVGIIYKFSSSNKFRKTGKDSLFQYVHKKLSEMDFKKIF